MTSRRSFFKTGAAVGAGLLINKLSFAANDAQHNDQALNTAGKAPALMSRSFTSNRSTTHYWEAGPGDGPLMIFVHGWPEIALVWRAQMEAFASEGWRCIAPDLRGFGDSSAPKAKEAYATKEMVMDMAELHAHLGGKAAIWVGHDWGSPIVASLAAHDPKISRGLVLISVPYMPGGWALPNLIPLIDRTLYPASVGKVSPSALVTANGGRFGAAHRAPATEPDYTLWPKPDFEALVAAFKKTGFGPCASYYMNDDANIAYAKTAVNNGKFSHPVLFINDEYEPFSNINLSKVGDPMRDACSNLLVVDQPSGHWLPLERKHELTETIRLWITLNGLK